MPLLILAPCYSLYHLLVILKLSMGLSSFSCSIIIFFICRFRSHCTFTPSNNVRKFTRETSIICLVFLLLVSSNYFSKT